MARIPAQDALLGGQYTSTAERPEQVRHRGALRAQRLEARGFGCQP